MTERKPRPALRRLAPPRRPWKGPQALAPAELPGYPEAVREYRCDSGTFLLSCVCRAVSFVSLMKGEPCHVQPEGVED
jgi:hypothetical protein